MVNLLADSSYVTLEGEKLLLVGKVVLCVFAFAFCIGLVCWFISYLNRQSLGLKLRYYVWPAMLVPLKAVLGIGEYSSRFRVVEVFRGETKSFRLEAQSRLFFWTCLETSGYPEPLVHKFKLMLECRSKKKVRQRRVLKEWHIKHISKTGLYDPDSSRLMKSQELMKNLVALKMPETVKDIVVTEESLS
jgi:hypothetical protein